MNSFGGAIKHWRKSRGFSQLDLSLYAGVSSKHISFVETNRANASKEMVLKLCQALEVPLSDRNVLLSLAGFSEAYSRMDITHPKMQAVNNALDLILDSHNPYPAMVFDWDWNIIKANESQQKIGQLVRSINPDFSNSCNIMELLFDPNGYRPFIKNWDEVAFSLFQRVQKERLLQPDRHSDLIEKLLSFPNVPTQFNVEHLEKNIEPMLYIDLVLPAREGGNDLSLKLFSTISSFGTAVDITMQELVVEQYFAVDETTKVFFEGL